MGCWPFGRKSNTPLGLFGSEYSEGKGDWEVPRQCRQACQPSQPRQCGGTCCHEATSTPLPTVRTPCRHPSSVVGRRSSVVIIIVAATFAAAGIVVVAAAANTAAATANVAVAVAAVAVVVVVVVVVVFV